MTAQNPLQVRASSQESFHTSSESRHPYPQTASLRGNPHFNYTISLGSSWWTTANSGQCILPILPTISPLLLLWNQPSYLHKCHIHSHCTGDTLIAVLLSPMPSGPLTSETPTRQWKPSFRSSWGSEIAWDLRPCFLVARSWGGHLTSCCTVNSILQIWLWVLSIYHIIPANYWVLPLSALLATNSLRAAHLLL